MKRNLLLLVSNLISFCLAAQTDTAFWFVAPEITIQAPGNFDRPIYLRLSTHSLPSNIIVSQPANPAFVPITLNMASNSSGVVDLTPFIDSIENKPANQVNNYGLYIKGTNVFSVYYEMVGGATATCNGCNPEFFSLKGKNALGTNFYIPFQKTYYNEISWIPAPRSAFDIVATEDSSIITITPSQSLVGHSAGTPFTINLDQGQTYSAVASGYLAADHPSGSEVSSNRPIAITMKDDLVRFPAFGSDLYGDQLVPVDKIGSEYIVIKAPSSQNDLAVITATQNNTQISVNGIVVTTIGAGQTYQYALNTAGSGAIYISASNPIYVLQITTSVGEFGGAILPSIGCSGSSEVSVTRSGNKPFWVFLITQNGNQGNFLFNGTTGVITSASFQTVPGTGGAWYYALIDLSSTATVGSVNNISNSSGLFQMGLLQGMTGGSGYGYFSDFSVVNHVFTKNLCASATISLHASVPSSIHLWNTGETSDTILVNAANTYWVQSSLNGCIQTDTFHVLSAGFPGTVLTTSNGTTCGNNNGVAAINVSSGSPPFTYLWSNGGINDTIANLSAGNYSVTIHDVAGCSTTAGVTVNSSGTGNVVITADKFIMCSGDSARVCAPSGYTTYLWNTGLSDSCLYAKLAGNYYVVVTDNGNCTAASNHLAIVVHQLPPVSISVNGDTLTAYDAVSYQWYRNDIPIPMATFGIYIVTQPGDYNVAIVDSNGCNAVSTKVSITTGMNNLNGSESWKVFPNPIYDGRLTLDVGANLMGCEIEIFDSYGKYTYQFKVTNRNSNILLNMEQGIYFIKINSSGKSEIKKIIKL